MERQMEEGREREGGREGVRGGEYLRTTPHISAQANAVRQGSRRSPAPRRPTCTDPRPSSPASRRGRDKRGFHRRATHVCFKHFVILWLSSNGLRQVAVFCHTCTDPAPLAAAPESIRACEISVRRCRCSALKRSSPVHLCCFK